MAKVKIRCAWCQKMMGEKEPVEDEGITDGICDSCLAKHFPNIAEKVAKLDMDEQDRYSDYKVVK